MPIFIDYRPWQKLQTLVFANKPTSVEWGDVAGDVFGEVLTVELAHDDDNDDVRHITISVDGHGWDSRWERLKESVRSWRGNS
jgi:hypothetical protein